MEAAKVKKKFVFPHSYIIIISILFIVCILTAIIPAGSFERVTTASGTKVVDPASFKFIENTPVSLTKIPVMIVNGFYNGRSLIFAIAIFTGAMQIIMATGMLQAATHSIIKVFSKKQSVALIAIMSIIGILSSPMGYNPFIAFVPVGLLVAQQLGYDELVGVGMVCLAASLGPNAGMLNPSTTGVGNELAGLPTYNGFGYRCVGFVVLSALTIGYLARYANKVKADPTSSYVYGIPRTAVSGSDEVPEFTTRRKIVGVAMLIGIVILVLGCTKFNWGFTEMSAFFMVFGVVCGLIYGLGGNEMCNEFTKGFKSVSGALIIVGLAYSISIALNNGNILDTIVYYIAGALKHLPAFLQAPAMLVAHTFINFFVTSGSGQAVLTMPIMLPIAQIIGMQPETAILALNYGDGLSNLIYPHSAALVAFLALSNVPYEKWMKLMAKLFGWWFLAASLLLVIAQVIGY